MDLIDRLMKIRDAHYDEFPVFEASEVCELAADEIVRLRKELQDERELRRIENYSPTDPR